MKAKIFFMIYTTHSITGDGTEECNNQIFAILIYC
jgi:hypothetical protein